MGTKDNPGKYDCYGRAEGDEPMFTLLARDPMSPVLVRMWAQCREIAARHGGDLTKAEEARKCADEMERWKGDHPDRGFPG